MVLYMVILMENYIQLISLKPKESWIKIVHQQVQRYKYGYRGEVAWYTEKNPTINRIGSIHLELSSRIQYLF